MSTLKVNELDTKSGTTITVAAGKTLAGTDIIDTTQIAAGAVTNAKTDFQPGTTFKGDGSTADGKITLNCSQNTHGVSIQSPAHASAASYTLTLPTTDGSADEFMQTDGSGVLSWASAAAGFNSMQLFTASGTWTKPTGVTKIVVEVQGAGGAGARHTTAGNCGGGTAGGYVMAVLDVTNIDTATVVVGSGGTGTNVNGAGADGGLSSFTKLAGSGSFTALSATGGNGGAGVYETGTAGVGGTGPVGALIISSGNTGGGLGTEWFGGESKFGFAGTAAYSSYTQYPNASGYGAGGGGAYTITAGNGTGGLVLVWEYK